jgi:twitching motility protein PilT
VDRLNAEGWRGIVTLEHPIEFHHTPAEGTWLVQQEVGRDTPTFARGVRDAMRATVNTVFVGEIQDGDAAAAALEVAEKGPLVIATTHARNASQAVERFVSAFPDGDNARIRLLLAHALVGIIALRLLPKIGGRVGELVPAYEIFRAAKVRHLIRDGAVDDIRKAIVSRADGMISLEQRLTELVAAKTVSLVDARRAAVFADEVK